MKGADDVSISRLLKAIKALPSDQPVYDPKKWYLTQKQHWIGWLREYHGPGAYCRVGTKRRNAQFAYNHIVEPEMLLWLAKAAGVSLRLVTSARRKAKPYLTKQQQSAVIRQLITWKAVAEALWSERD